MKIARPVVMVLALVFGLTAPTGALQRWCTVPCGHPIHQYDVGPCMHPCYYPNGVFACHPAGDMYPCTHRVHPFDYIPC